jgi:oligopeptide/dipeptide ABC transporter ATP-binding protein
MSEALIDARSLRVCYPVRRGAFGWSGGSELAAIDDVSLRVERGRSLALVGESGSGKTTLARALLRLVEPSAGELRFDGVDLLALAARPLRRLRRDFQMVFQDPHGSLDPRRTVRQTLAEPLAIHRLVPRDEVSDRVMELLALVGLTPMLAERRPRELSGGQRQRVCIARALATNPKLLVADEPVSALDVSVQAQIVNLLSSLQRELGLTLLFIGHDLAVVEQLADRVAVLYLGRIVEEANARDLFAQPQHPYTASLLSAVPVPDPRGRRRRIVLAGEPPDPASPPAGCRFHTRCPIARPRCAASSPPLAEVRPGHAVACFYPGELDPKQAGSVPPA